ncbi:NAD(P)-binding domain-containing protein, partial [Nocardia sp. NPDC004582]
MTNTQHSPVTVLGLGAMGRALAGRFAHAGIPVTVWNRTPGRGADVVAVIGTVFGVATSLGLGVLQIS